MTSSRTWLVSSCQCPKLPLQQLQHQDSWHGPKFSQACHESAGVSSNISQFSVLEICQVSPWLTNLPVPQTGRLLQNPVDLVEEGKQLLADRPDSFLDSTWTPIGSTKTSVLQNPKVLLKLTGSGNGECIDLDCLAKILFWTFENYKDLVRHI